MSKPKKECEKILCFILLTFFLSINLANSSTLETVLHIKSIKNKQSIDYQIAAYRAAIDLLNQGKSALSSGNSGKALRSLEAGVQLFPHHGQLRRWRKKAMDTFIKSTQKMIKNPEVTCKDILERFNYLKTIGPDHITRIRGLKKRCTPKPFVKYRFNPLKNNPLNILEVKIPRIYYPADKISGTLIEKLDATIFKNTNEEYPFVEQLILGLEFFGDFSIITNEISVNSKSRNRNSVDLDFTYFVDWSQPDFTFYKFCRNLSRVFSQYQSSNNSTSNNCIPTRLRVSGILPLSDGKSTSIKRLNVQKEMVGYNKPFTRNFLPQFLVFKKFETRKNKLKYVGKHVLRSSHRDPTAWLILSPYVMANDHLYLDNSGIPSDPSHEFNFESSYRIKMKGLKRNYVKELEKITLQFDPKATYEIYMKIYRNSIIEKKPFQFKREFDKYLSHYK